MTKYMHKEVYAGRAEAESFVIYGFHIGTQQEVAEAISEIDKDSDPYELLEESSVDELVKMYFEKCLPDVDINSIYFDCIPTNGDSIQLFEEGNVLGDDNDSIDVFLGLLVPKGAITLDGVDLPTEKIRKIDEMADAMGRPAPEIVNVVAASIDY